MDAFPLLVTVLAFLAFDFVSARFGADSRDLIPDDHQR